MAEESSRKEVQGGNGENYQAKNTRKCPRKKGICLLIKRPIRHPEIEMTEGPTSQHITKKLQGNKDKEKIPKVFREEKTSQNTIMRNQKGLRT